VAESIEASAVPQRIEARRSACIDGFLGEPFPLPEAVQRLPTCRIAFTVSGVTGTEGRRPVSDGPVSAVDLDLTRWWSATGEACLRHVSRAPLFEMLHKLLLHSNGGSDVNRVRRETGKVLARMVD
jgi:ParB family transcriptional regulator, chromosome partitioning protein